MRVEFGDVPLVGELLVPQGEGPRPALIFTGPFTSVKEQVAGLYAARLADRGLVTLALDHRNHGESGGLPRRHEDAAGKLADLRVAVSFLRARPEVSAVGVAGIGLGAGYALRFAAFDPRVSWFIGIAGGYPSPYTTRFEPGEALEARERQDRGGPVEYGPAVDDELAAHFGQTPGWANEATLASALEVAGLDAMIGADFLSPTPALLIHGVVDAHCPPEGAHEVYARLSEPKRLRWLDARGHLDLYTEPLVGQAVEEISAFLAE